MPPQKNLGILIAPPRPDDYILGSTSKIVTNRVINDWSIYLPKVETQKTKVDDMLDCVSMSGPDHSIATQLNYLLANNELWDEALNFFHNNNYIVDGLFSLSARYSAKMNGTDKTMGQYLNVAADHVRSDGILSETDWPQTDTMTWDEFYKDIPADLIVKAKKFLWFVDVKWEWVDTKNIVSSFPSAPVQVSTEVCAGWDSGQVVQKCSGQPLQHATMLYGRDTLGNWKNLDHYPPYKQLLAPDYELPFNLRYIVTARPLTLRKGMHGTNVLQMQKFLYKLGYVLGTDSSFGPKTEMQVKNFQSDHGLDVDGIAGQKTLAKLKELSTPYSLLDALIKVESGGNDLAEGDTTLTNHAYGCLQIRQGVCDDVNQFFGTDFRSQDCLGNRLVSLDIWNKYWKVFPNILTDEDRARTWNGGPGWKKIYFKSNKTPKEIQYCKNLDSYWSQVKKLLSV